MKRDIIVKVVIQVVACGFALLGLLCAFFGAGFVATAVRNSEWSSLFFTAPFFFALGGIGIALAWWALKRFGPNAIRNVVGFSLFLAWSQLAWFPESSQHAEPRWQGDLLEAALVLGPVFLAFLLYRILSRKLIQMTGTDDAPDPVGVPCEGGSTSRKE